MKKLFARQVRRGMRTAACGLLVAICIVSQMGCAGKEPVSGTDFLLNTACSITLYDAENQSEGEELIRQTFRLCRDYENRLSRTVADSDIGRINSAGGQAVEVDATTAEVIEKGLEYARLSGGLFDITVGELSELWNFTGDKPSVPPGGELAEAVSHVGYGKVEILSGTPKEQGDERGHAVAVQLSNPKTKLDLGGIAKGYIADKAGDYLREAGIQKAVVNFGGNIVCIGEKEEDKPFVIGIERPFSSEGGGEKEILGTVSVADMSIVTSGTYERKFYEKGKLYYHILDPATGYPRDTDLDGVSIVGPSAVNCDGLSTSCLMLGLEEGKALIESLEGYEAVFVCKDGQIVATGGLEFTLAQ